MKRTAFHALHREAGARLVEFGGFEMPVQYSSIIDEHMAVRSRVGIFDVSHMGEFELHGPDALKLLQYVTINDAAKLQEGRVQYSALCYPDGGIVDDLLVYHRGDHYMLVVNAANTAKDFEWIRQASGRFDCELTDRSDLYSLLAVQGPRSLELLSTITSRDLAPLPYYHAMQTEIAGIPTLVSRTGYTGELGYELYFDSSVATGEVVWRALIDAGQPFDVRPIGLGARDTLRLEMGFCLYGNDIDQTTNPLEAGLGWITKLEKGDFIGREALLRVKKNGLHRKLAGIVTADGKTIPRHGYEVRRDGTVLGHVTSGSVSPTLGRGIGLCYVQSDAAAVGSHLTVLIRQHDCTAEIVKIPFIAK